MLVTINKASSVENSAFSLNTMNSSRALFLTLLHFVLLHFANGFQLSRPHATSVSMRSKIVSSVGFTVHGNRRLHQHSEQINKSTQLYMAEKNASGNKVETKYVIAGIVFILACLFDFFRMHGGQMYLAHP